VVPVSVAISADVGQVVETAAAVEVGVAALLEGVDVPAAVLGELVEGAVVLDAPHAARSSTLKKPIPAAPGWRRWESGKTRHAPLSEELIRMIGPTCAPTVPYFASRGCPVGPAP